MKKLLLIAYHFPPDAEVGGIRAAKFAKYLPEFGYEPYVLTIKEKNIRQKDENRLKDVREIKIFRTALWPNIMEILLKLRDFVFLRTVIKGSGSVSGTTDSYQPPEVNPPGPIRAGNTSGLILHIKRFLDSILELPDKMIGWLIPAERDVDDLARNLEKVVSSPEIWGKLGYNARQHIEKEYNVRVQIQKLEDIYQKVACLNV